MFGDRVEEESGPTWTGLLEHYAGQAAVGKLWPLNNAIMPLDVMVA